MKNTERIEQEIDKTMASLDGIKRANARPFFYTRLEAKMQQRYVPSTKIVLRPAFIWSFLAVIILINLSVVLNYSQKSKNSNEQNASSFAQEYGLSTPMFDLNL
jgi:hypothetical protein